MSHTRSTAGAEAIRERNRLRAVQSHQRRARQKAQLAAKARQAYDGYAGSQDDLNREFAERRAAFYARQGKSVPS
jgi:hypothetical protein